MRDCLGLHRTAGRDKDCRRCRARPVPGRHDDAGESLLDFVGGGRPRFCTLVQQLADKCLESRTHPGLPLSEQGRVSADILLCRGKPVTPSTTHQSSKATCWSWQESGHWSSLGPIHGAEDRWVVFNAATTTADANLDGQDRCDLARDYITDFDEWLG